MVVLDGVLMKSHARLENSGDEILRDVQLWFGGHRWEWKTNTISMRYKLRYSDP